MDFHLRRHTNLLIITLLFMVSSCQKDTPLDCTSSDLLMTAWFNFHANDANYEQTSRYDTQIHEYTFSTNKDGTICSLGYQSHPEISQYEIELIDADDNILFNDLLSFDSTSTEYHEISPVNIRADKKYTIRRKCNDFAYINFTIGRVLIPSSKNQLNRFNFPIVVGSMTIHQTAFYQDANGPVALSDIAIPYIDLGFVPN